MRRFMKRWKPMKKWAAPRSTASSLRVTSPDPIHAAGMAAVEAFIVASTRAHLPGLPAFDDVTQEDINQHMRASARAVRMTHEQWYEQTRQDVFLRLGRLAQDEAVS